MVGESCGRDPQGPNGVRPWLFPGTEEVQNEWITKCEVWDYEKYEKRSISWADSKGFG